MRVSNLMGVSNLMVVYEGFGAPIDFETHIQANFVFIWRCMHIYI